MMCCCSRAGTVSCQQCKYRYEETDTKIHASNFGWDRIRLISSADRTSIVACSYPVPVADFVRNRERKEEHE